MGSRGQQPGRRVEDHFARPRPPSVRWEKERSQSAAANPKKESKSKDTVTTRQAKAGSPKVVPCQSQRSARHSPPVLHTAAHAKIQRLQAAISAWGDADMVEKESLVKSLQHAQAQAVVHPRLRTDHFDAGIYRAGEEEIGCRRGGSSCCCQEPGRESRSIGTRGEAPGRVAVAGEELLRRSRCRRRSRLGSPPSASGRIARIHESCRTACTRVSPAEMPGLIPAHPSAWMEDRQKDVLEVPRESREQTNQINLEEAFLGQVPMLKSVPYFMRGRFRHNLTVTLQERCRAKLLGDRVGEERPLKALGLAPAMLLHKTKRVGSIGRVELMERANKFARGQWADLLEELCHYTHSSRPGVTRSKDSTCGVQDLDEIDAEQKRRGEAACNRVKQGQVSRARRALTGAALAPGTLETLGRVATTQTARTGPLAPKPPGLHTTARAQTCVVERAREGLQR